MVLVRVPLLLSLEPVGLGKGVGKGVAEKNADGSWIIGRSDLKARKDFILMFNANYFS